VSAPDDIGTQRATMIALGDELRKGMDPVFEKAGARYVLLIFSPEPPGFARFVSNVEEPEAMRAMKETVLRLEQGDTIDDPQETPE
jgi:hypothetical protein